MRKPSLYVMDKAESSYLHVEAHDGLAPFFPDFPR